MSEPSVLNLVVGLDGAVSCIYDELLDLRQIGSLNITRAPYFPKNTAISGHPQNFLFTPIFAGFSSFSWFYRSKRDAGQSALQRLGRQPYEHSCVM